MAKKSSHIRKNIYSLREDFFVQLRASFVCVPVVTQGITGVLNESLMKSENRPIPVHAKKNKMDFHISLGFHEKGVRLAGLLQKKWH